MCKFKRTFLQLFEHMDRLFPVLLELLSDSSDEVLLLDLHLISDICQGEHKTVDRESLGLSESAKGQVSVRVYSSVSECKSVASLCVSYSSVQLIQISPFLIKFSISLIAMFEQDSQLLTERGVLIIRYSLSPVSLVRHANGGASLSFPVILLIGYLVGLLALVSFQAAVSSPGAAAHLPLSLRASSRT